MSAGLLGKQVSIANNNVTVYTAPGTVQFATIRIKVVNIGGTESNVRIAIASTGTPGPGDYEEYNRPLKANGGWLELSCIPISPNENVVIWADSGNVGCSVRGLEQV